DLIVTGVQTCALPIYLQERGLLRRQGRSLASAGPGLRRGAPRRARARSRPDAERGEDRRPPPLRRLQTPRSLPTLPRDRAPPWPGRRQPHHLVVRALPGLSAARPLGEVLDEAAARRLQLVAGRGPEGHRIGLLGFDDRVQALGTEGAETLLARPDHPRREPSPSVCRIYGEPVEGPPPAVPADDQRADDLACGVGEQQRVGIALQEPKQVVHRS